MLIIQDENSINKKSVMALSKISKKEKITALEVSNFFYEYGILIPNKQEIKKLEKLFKIKIMSSTPEDQIIEPSIEKSQEKMKRTETNEYRLFNARNTLMTKALSNRHSFTENFYWDVPNFCLAIKVTVGGDESGNVAIVYIYSGEDFIIRSQELYISALIQYEKNYLAIKKNY